MGLFKRKTREENSSLNLNNLTYVNYPVMTIVSNSFIFHELLYGQAKVYEICRKTCDDGMDGTDIFPEHPELLGDRY